MRQLLALNRSAGPVRSCLVIPAPPRVTGSPDNRSRPGPSPQISVRPRGWPTRLVGVRILPR